MKEMVKNLARIVGFILVVLTIIAFLAWVNNIVIALQWRPSQVKEEAGKIIRPVYQGFIYWLDWSAVDYSTITTLIPFFGLFLITVRCFQIASAKKGTDVSEYFPSFKYYEAITVALGLIGTVWGLIMIGYYNIQTLTNPQLMMPELIRCMHTALYSTLIALVWVFVFIYPAKWIMPKAYRCVSGYRGRKSDENILSLLNNLGSAAAGATDAINQTTSSVGGFNGQITHVQTTLKESVDFLGGLKAVLGGVASEIKGIVSQLDSQFKVWQRAVEEQQKTAQEIQKMLNGFNDELTKERKLREKAEERANQAEKVKEALHRTAEFFQKLLGGL